MEKKLMKLFIIMTVLLIMPGYTLMAAESDDPVTNGNIPVLANDLVLDGIAKVIRSNSLKADLDIWGMEAVYVEDIDYYTDYIDHHAISISISNGDFLLKLDSLKTADYLEDSISFDLLLKDGDFYIGDSAASMWFYVQDVRDILDETMMFFEEIYVDFQNLIIESRFGEMNSVIVERDGQHYNKVTKIVDRNNNQEYYYSDDFIEFLDFFLSAIFEGYDFGQSGVFNTNTASEIAYYVNANTGYLETVRLLIYAEIDIDNPDLEDVLFAYDTAMELNFSDFNEDVIIPDGNDILNEILDSVYGW